MLRQARCLTADESASRMAGRPVFACRRNTTSDAVPRPSPNHHPRTVRARMRTRESLLVRRLRKALAASGPFLFRCELRVSFPQGQTWSGVRAEHLEAHVVVSRFMRSTSSMFTPQSGPMKSSFVPWAAGVKRIRGSIIRLCEAAIRNRLCAHPFYQSGSGPGLLFSEQWSLHEPRERLHVAPPSTARESAPV